MVCQPHCRVKNTLEGIRSHSICCFCFIEHETEYKMYWMNNFGMPVTHHSYSHSCIVSTLNDLFRLTVRIYVSISGHFMQFSLINHHSCSSSVYSLLSTTELHTLSFICLPKFTGEWRKIIMFIDDILRCVADVGNDNAFFFL